MGPGREEERSSTLPLCRTGASEGQNMQLEPQYTVKWSLLELMSVLSLHELKCMLTSACSSLVNTTHLIILSPAWPSAEETLDLDGKEYPKKVLVKRLYWKLRNGDAQIFPLTIPIQTDRLGGSGRPF